ncbi:MAG: hypothetical protein K8S54_11515 [Spirochaetia bacterium]|nr:hypothetical protein [Spirochaetia bacterium]
MPGIIVWCLVALVLQWFGAALEYMRGIPILFWLDIFSGSMAALAIVALRPRNISWSRRRGVVLALLWFTILAEIETGFHDPDFVFTHSQAWIPITLCILFLVFVFPGTSLEFCGFVAFLVLAHMARGFSERHDLFQSREGLLFVFQFVSTCVICCAIHGLVFRFRTQRRNRDREVRNYRLQLARIKVAEEVRSVIVRDIHDLLGSRLTDMVLLTSRIRRQVEPGLLDQLEMTSREISQAFRAGIMAEKDRLLLRRDFANGVRAVLYRRYEMAGKQIRVTTSDEEALELISTTMRDELLAILLELTTNDLKYGQSSAYLSLRGKNGKRGHSIVFLSSTVHPESTGLGSDSIQRRTRKLSGTATQRIRGGRIIVHFRFGESVLGLSPVQ